MIDFVHSDICDVGVHDLFEDLLKWQAKGLGVLSDKCLRRFTGLPRSSKTMEHEIYGNN